MKDICDNVETPPIHLSLLVEIAKREGLVDPDYSNSFYTPISEGVFSVYIPHKYGVFSKECTTEEYKEEIQNAIRSLADEVYRYANELSKIDKFFKD